MTKLHRVSQRLCIVVVAAFFMVFLCSCAGTENRPTAPAVSVAESKAKPEQAFSPDPGPPSKAKFDASSITKIVVPSIKTNPTAIYRRSGPRVNADMPDFEIPTTGAAKQKTNARWAPGPVTIEKTGTPDPQPLAWTGIDIQFLSTDFDDNGTFNLGFRFIPPDPHAAAGPNHVVNVVNTTIAFHQKNGTLDFQDDLAGFFSSLTPLTFTFDPKVLYDQYADRWVVITMEQTAVLSGDPADTSRMFVAVSDDSNPNGTWFVAEFDTVVTISSTDHWADYPGFAVDEEAVYITANLFSFAGGLYGGSRVWILEKGEGAGGFYDSGGTLAVAEFDPYAVDGIATTTQPSHMFGTGPGGVGVFLVSYSGLSNASGQFIQVVRIDNPLGTPVVCNTTTYNIPANTWTRFALPCSVAANTVADIFDLDPAGYGDLWGVFWRDSATPEYFLLPLAGEMTEGIGYWVFSTEATQVSLEGSPAAINDIDLVGLHPAGRDNLAGHNQNVTVAWNQVQVVDGASVLGIANYDKKRGPNFDCDPPVHKNCVMSRIMYKWNGNVYEVFDGDDGGISPGTLDPFDAFWVQAFKPGIKLRIPVGAAVPTFTQSFVFMGDIDNLSVGIPDMPQLGTATLIESNDRRALDAVWRDNSLWLTTTINPNSGIDSGDATALWLKIDTTTLPTLVVADSGTIGGEDIAPGTYTTFPSIAVNASEDVVVGFSASAPSIFAGAYFVDRQASDPAGFTGSAVTVKAGVDQYIRTFGGPRNRWGDYSATAVDPVDDCFWVYNEWADFEGTDIGGELGRWGTAYVKTCPVTTPASAAQDASSVKSRSSTQGQGPDKPKKPKGKSWYIRLIASAGDMEDPGNVLGQRDTAADGNDPHDLEEPAPFGDTYLSILFTNPLFAPASWGFTTDIRALTKKPQGVWPFVVRASAGIDEGTIRWEGEDSLFKNTWLVDEQNGEVIKIHAGDSYTFEIVGGEHYFRFELGNG